DSVAEGEAKHMTDAVEHVIAALTKRGRQRGFLTMAEVQQELEDAEAAGEAFESVLENLRSKGIKLTEEGPEVEVNLDEVTEIAVSDPVRMYLNEIGRYRLLTAQQEVELSMALEAGQRAQERLEKEELSEEDAAVLRHSVEEGELARRRLVEANLRLVVSIARRYVGRGLAMLDLIQEGNMGLMRAVERFDYRQGFKFSTYATWWSRQAISDLEDAAVLRHSVEEGELARRRLVEANLRLVVSIARRYVGRGLAMLDLIQEGNMGLMRAVERFDYRKGFKFSTYATWWIRQAI